MGDDRFGRIVTEFMACIDKQHKRNRLPVQTVTREILAVEDLFLAQPKRCLTLFAGYIGRAPRQWRTRSFEETSQGQTLFLVQLQLDVWLTRENLAEEFLQQVRQWSEQYKDYHPNPRNLWSGQIYRFLAQGLVDPVDRAFARLSNARSEFVWAPAAAVTQARTTEPPLRQQPRREANVSQGLLF